MLSRVKPTGKWYFLDAIKMLFVDIELLVRFCSSTAVSYLNIQSLQTF